MFNVVHLCGSQGQLCNDIFLEMNAQEVHEMRRRYIGRFELQPWLQLIPSVFDSFQGNMLYFQLRKLHKPRN